MQRTDQKGGDCRGTSPWEVSSVGTPWISHPHHFLLSLFPSEVDEDRIPNPLLKVSWPVPQPSPGNPQTHQGIIPQNPPSVAPLTPSTHPQNVYEWKYIPPHSPHTVSLLTIAGRGREVLKKQEFSSPTFCSPHLPPFCNPKAWQGRGGRREGWHPHVLCVPCSLLCPCLHGNGRR